jgi:hypothetical protein
MGNPIIAFKQGKIVGAIPSAQVDIFNKMNNLAGR